ncbi:HEAT repeat protein [Providencia alcalifaciens]|nr:HEAT repeat protein [Providencia alcalifaciens]
MDKQIIAMLIDLTFRGNDDVKIAAISALGDYQATIEQEQAIIRLIELCKDPNKEVAVSSIKSLSKLSGYFTSLRENK